MYSQVEAVVILFLEAFSAKWEISRAQIWEFVLALK